MKRTSVLYEFLRDLRTLVNRYLGSLGEENVADILTFFGEVLSEQDEDMERLIEALGGEEVKRHVP